MVAADAIMPGVLIAQALGRWGNFFNQEAYGGMVSLDFLKSLHLPFQHLKPDDSLYHFFLTHH